MDKAFLGNLFAGQRAVVARAISIAERGGEEAKLLLQQIFSRTGRAARIGLTGPPGAGKSTLTAGLTKHLRGNDSKVAVIAVDPTSPFTHGAVLGDRIRMAEIGHDDQVFIRSMATRGNRGGLNANTVDAADVLDVAGFDYIFIESVGVGQNELEIEKVVDTTIVVLTPESGDQIQAIKAGLMEIADIYILNKSDRPGSTTVLQGLQSALSFSAGQNAGWDVQIMPAVATAGEGIGDIVAVMQGHRQFLIDDDRLAARRKRCLEARIRSSVDELLKTALWNDGSQVYLQKSIRAINAGKGTPISAAMGIVENYLQKYS